MVDGAIVLNPASLSVQAKSRQAGVSRKRVEESGSKLPSYVTNAGTRVNPEKWSVEDTNLFYTALKEFGTDFSLIERLFPGRNRRQIKRKWLKEEKKNPVRIEEALNYRSEHPSQQYRDMMNLLRDQRKRAQAGTGD